MKDSEDSPVSREDVSEAVNEALDQIIDEERTSIRKTNGSGIRALDQLNSIPNDVLKDSQEKIGEVIAQLFSEMTPTRSSREIRGLDRVDRETRGNRPLMNNILNVYQRP